MNGYDNREKGVKGMGMTKYTGNIKSQSLGISLGKMQMERNDGGARLGKASMKGDGKMPKMMMMKKKASMKGDGKMPKMMMMKKASMKSAGAMPKSKMKMARKSGMGMKGY